MSEDDAGPTWIETIRRWLWLDGPQRTDNSEANRGFYTSRRPVGRRFTLVVVLLGIAIGLVLLDTREAEARSADDPVRAVSAVTIAVTASAGDA